jgi:hypothetical protein
MMTVRAAARHAQTDPAAATHTVTAMIGGAGWVIPAVRESSGAGRGAFRHENQRTVPSHP